MQDFYIVDTTLRDGEQAPGVAFFKKEKVKIAKMLDEAGVDIIEAGIPIMGKEEMECIEQIIAMQGKAKILTWNRMHKRDVDASLRCGAENIHIAVPASDIQIWQKLKKDRSWVMKEMQKVVSYAAEKGCSVSVGAEDASRTEEDCLIELYKKAFQAGARRFRYADTLGVLNPTSSYQKIKRIQENIDGELDFHGHNDFGMATANTLSAFQAGAKYISCSVNGLGERAGNTALEEIVMVLKILFECKHPFEGKKMMTLSQLVEQASGRIIGDGKPIVGKMVFSHESGIHVDGLLKSRNCYEAFSPEEIGRKTEVILGKHSGSIAVIHCLQEMGIEIAKKQSDEIVKMIHQIYTHNKKPDIDFLLKQWTQVNKKVASRS
ncbi:homocitrate synthase [Geosporobacter ferrireducens]|uniref:homocitrate synthase n=1 Tax=Geosporobacter ferrireducens TaxID=1424294 RepID=UPI00139DB764|nr:homocitrate synthase [Geosporobacter ferrireducens]MTI57689.1 homocitrate synthase [Geosporobacter ferrireducens]